MCYISKYSTYNVSISIKMEITKFSFLSNFCAFYISDRDPRTIERANLLNVSKLIIKELIDSSMAHGRMLDDDHEPLQQFFVVLEHVLRHGLRR